MSIPEKNLSNSINMLLNIHNMVKSTFSFPCVWTFLKSSYKPIGSGKVYLEKKN